MNKFFTSPSLKKFIHNPWTTPIPLIVSLIVGLIVEHTAKVPHMGYFAGFLTIMLYMSVHTYISCKIPSTYWDE